MESLELLMRGFSIALQPTNLQFALLGSIIGTLVGILPGIGPVAGTAILIPLTFSLDPTPAIIMLAAIYYGAMYGGTLTSVLVNVPGEAASAITCLDGYEMAKQGRAGPALAMAAIGSFFARHRGDHGPGPAGAAAHLDRPAVRAARIFCADRARPVAGDRARQRLPGTRAALGGRRPPDRDGRDRSGDGSATLHVRHPGAYGRGGAGAGRHGPVRRQRDPAQPRTDDGAPGACPSGLADALGRGPQALHQPDPARHRPRFPHRPRSRRRCGGADADRLRRREARLAHARKIRQRHDRRRRRAGSGQQRVRQRRVDPAVHPRDCRARRPSPSSWAPS